MRLKSTYFGERVQMSSKEVDVKSTTVRSFIFTKTTDRATVGLRQYIMTIPVTCRRLATASQSRCLAYLERDASFPMTTRISAWPFSCSAGQGELDRKRWMKLNTKERRTGVALKDFEPMTRDVGKGKWRGSRRTV